MSQYHTPVLLEESVGLLAVEPAGTYADLTFGGGGHSRRILSDLGPEGRLYGLTRTATRWRTVPTMRVFTTWRAISASCGGRCGCAA